MSESIFSKSLAPFTIALVIPDNCQTSDVISGPFLTQSNRKAQNASLMSISFSSFPDSSFFQISWPYYSIKHRFTKALAATLTVKSSA